MKGLKIYLWVLSVSFLLLFGVQLLREQVYRTDKTTRIGFIEAPKYCNDAFSVFELYRAIFTQDEVLMNTYWRKDIHVRAYSWFVADAFIFYLPLLLAVWLLFKRQRKELLLFLLAVVCLYNIFFLYHDVRLDIAARDYVQPRTNAPLPGFYTNIIVKLFYIISTTVALLWTQRMPEQQAAAINPLPPSQPVHIALKKYLILITVLYLGAFIAENFMYLYEISGAQRWNLNKMTSEHCWSPVSFSKLYKTAGTFGGRGAFDMSGGSLFNRQPVTIFDWFLFYLPLLFSLLYWLFTQRCRPLLVMLAIVCAYNVFYFLYDKAAFTSMYRDYLPASWTVVNEPYLINQVIRAFYFMSSGIAIVWFLWRRRSAVSAT